MKITKSYLKQVIKEELNKMQEMGSVQDTAKPVNLEDYEKLLLKAKENIDKKMNYGPRLTPAELGQADSAAQVIKRYLDYIRVNKSTEPEVAFAELDRNNKEGRPLYIALQFAR